jgi:hypothetical protein
MKQFIADIDRLLRGGFTRAEDLAAGRIQVPVQALVFMGVLLGMLYGALMGLYGVLRPANQTYLQILADAVKVPLLFLLTLAVAFPSLYVFSALADSRLRLGETLRLLLASIVVDLALLASFGPVTGFFTLSTDSYAFMVVLNVAFFAVAGFAGLGFLQKALNVVFAGPPRAAPRETAASEAGPVDPAPAAFRRPELRQVASPRRIFTTWTVIYAVVGAQMGWILRPFIGAPRIEFSLFRQREGNVFEALLLALQKLFE